ncbi:DUF1257 domain-containing protein [Bremerella sp. JC770]|uniref:DUF1257 domain-containing protein n=1 Tax=Bremerella sp. JC770 TaxID=3232137 RepID=UPI003459FBC7
MISFSGGMPSPKNGLIYLVLIVARISTVHQDKRTVFFRSHISIGGSVSHIVMIQTEVRDLEAIRQATRRLQLPEPTFDEVQLFSERKTGWAIQLRDWRYPVVANLESGRVDFDNYGGRWGKQQELDQFLQRYAVEAAVIQARKQGHSTTEQTLADGSIKLLIQVGGVS